MASIPPTPSRQQSQRRPSPDHTLPAPPSSTVTRSATLEHPQTLFVKDSPQEEQPQAEDMTTPPPPSPPPPVSADEDPNVKKCWICFSDSTEDTPDSAPWRDPCPCALVAHEVRDASAWFLHKMLMLTFYASDQDCLLDWIADMESPKNARHRAAARTKIECPQCKSEIKLARPRNVVVDAYRELERIGLRSITPAALLVVGATLWTSSLQWGIHSIYAVFGHEDGARILHPLLLNAIRPPLEVFVGKPQEALDRLVGLVMDHLVHWRLYLGLPLLTPILILSRTKFANSVLPVLPILFFATQAHSPDASRLGFRHWPPSASLCFAVLPYIRTMYNTYYDEVWAAKEKRWLKQIQPRQGSSANEGEDQSEDGVDAALDEILEDGIEDEEGDNMFELRIDGGIWDNVDEDEDPGQPQPDAQANRVAPPLQQPPLADGDAQAEPPPNIPDDRPEPPAPQAQPQPQIPQRPRRQPNAAAGNRLEAGERRHFFSATAIAQTVIGALLFPTIAGMSGELLKLLLPRAWTTGPASSSLGARTPAKGLLQEKWGRSFVGGCLFVVAKDALVLYVRWRMAESHRKRRVLDYTGERRRV
ncbi:RING-variant domain-containing protein 2 [Teratosphaeria destructans]|uniref:RING-variant domain-containing protein 2 n=1 Tax=Teratosphaeria destructans TaxID=418781 RepID=A0A9W7T0Q2_9PEZI|nr:RING-variant domain-containing protein 2 [Teratosphaeria destructans]